MRALLDHCSNHPWPSFNSIRSLGSTVNPNSGEDSDGRVNDLLNFNSPFHEPEEVP